MAPVAQAQAVDLPLLPGLSDSDESPGEQADPDGQQNGTGPGNETGNGDSESDTGSGEDNPLLPGIGGDDKPDDAQPNKPGDPGENGDPTQPNQPGDPGENGEDGALPTGGEPATGQPAEGEWSMTASSLTLRGSRFHGSTEQELGGETVSTLHFTAEGVEAEDLVKRADLGNGATLQVAGAPGSVSEIAGPVDMQVRKLSGTLEAGGFPLVPLTLSADVLKVPGLDLSFLKLPDLTFADATADNVILSSSSLNVPGARITVED